MFIYTDLRVYLKLAFDLFSPRTILSPVHCYIILLTHIIYNIFKALTRNSTHEKWLNTGIDSMIFLILFIHQYTDKKPDHCDASVTICNI